jgi:hypothetical protein
LKPQQSGASDLFGVDLLQGGEAGCTPKFLALTGSNSPLLFARRENRKLAQLCPPKRQEAIPVPQRVTFSDIVFLIMEASMSKRIIIGIDQQAEWNHLKQEIRNAGAHDLSDPTPSQPDAVVATLEDSVDVSAFIAKITLLPGVRYAEPDAWASTGPLISP